MEIGISLYIELRLTDDCHFGSFLASRFLLRRPGSPGVQWKSCNDCRRVPCVPHTPSSLGAHLMFIKFMKISAMIYDSFGGSWLPTFPLFRLFSPFCPLENRFNEL